MSCTMLRIYYKSATLQHSGHTYTKQLLAVYLKFKLTGSLVFLFATSGNSTKASLCP